ncbi:MAG: LTA synthase family protein [Rhizobiaceae bacterium]|nr:LTA synthase family protein [Rhizobiaceae bacterium]
MAFAPYAHPVPLAVCSFLAAMLVVVATDRFALSPSARAGALREAARSDRRRDLVARALLVLLVFAFFFAISWRPLYCLAGTISFFAIFTAISRVKYTDIREPLVFSDVALVLLLFRHREIFRATFTLYAVVALGVLYVFGASTLFYLYEPALLPGRGSICFIAAAVILAIVPWLLLFLPSVRRIAARAAERLIGSASISALTLRVGTFGAMIFGVLAWLGDRPRPVPGPVDLPATPSGQRPLLIVWQSESFVDMRRHGADIALPNLDALRRRAVSWGRFSSVFEGGYTLRTEFAVLSGLPPEALGPDASHPYLRPEVYADVVWPARLLRSGWATRFIHPYDPVFFSRDRALPRLGFEKLSMIDDFDHDPRRSGPYVSDIDLTGHVLRACASDVDRAGQFVFVASMENHGPWSPGRYGDASDPIDIYLGLLERSDQALGHLVEELDRLDRPVWLVFYGDHPPILKSFADPFPDALTDYVIVPLGGARGQEISVEPGDMAPWHLIAKTLSHMASRGDPARPE